MVQLSCPWAASPIVDCDRRCVLLSTSWVSSRAIVAREDARSGDNRPQQRSQPTYHEPHG
eukprot:1650362-Pyramimonas_sp.AAC.1